MVERVRQALPYLNTTVIVLGALVALIKAYVNRRG